MTRVVNIGMNMNPNNMMDENRSTLKPYSWKVVLGLMALSILMNIIFVIINLTHFNTFNGAPFAELLANILLYVGNWPSLLLHNYPYVIAGGGEIVYEGFGWVNPATFITNLLGWGLLGFVCSYVNRKSKGRSKTI